MIQKPRLYLLNIAVFDTKSVFSVKSVILHSLSFSYDILFCFKSWIVTSVHSKTPI